MGDPSEPAQSASVWRFDHATRAHVVIDADAYFKAAREAMLQAQCRIMLIGWDFDTRISLVRQRRKKGDPPKRLGDFIVWLAERRPELEIRILKWGFGTIKTLGRGRTLLDIARWAVHKQIAFKFDNAHPVGCSHHQKIVVIDDNFAVCGGIDMTSDRWDTRDHLDDDPRRIRPNRRPHGPWHDVTMLLEGPAAGALGELARTRWVAAGGDVMEPCPLREGSAWPEGVNAEFRDVDVGIARTRAAYEDASQIREIEHLFAEQIARAKTFIYAETQYFASRVIADAVAKRMAEPDAPEIFIVNPETADGWLEQKAMDSVRVRLLRAIGEHDTTKRFNIFVPFTAGGAPIYVHAKLMIVDDEILRVGSANMNNRSLGLDSECDVFIDSSRAPNAHAKAAIRGLRLSLLAEHCGTTAEEIGARIADRGSMRAAVKSFAGAGRSLRRLELPELTEAERVIADNAALDPERPEEMFEPFSSPGIFARSRWLRTPDKG